MKQLTNIPHIILLFIAITMIACSKDEPIEDNEPMRINLLIKYMDDLPQQKTIYNYDNNKIKTIYKYDYSDYELWEYTRKTEFNYPTEKEILVLEFKYLDSTWVEDAKMVHTYEGDKRIKTERHNLKSSGVKSIQTIIYTYENDKIQNKTIYYNGTDSINIYLMASYYWNVDQALFGDGYLMTEQGLIHHRRDSLFYMNGNISKSIYYNIPANKPESKTTIEYLDNTISNYSHYFYLDNTWSEFYNRTYTYNDNLYLIQINDDYGEFEYIKEFNYEKGSGNFEQIQIESNWPKYSIHVY